MEEKEMKVRSHPEGFLDESLRPLIYNRQKIYGPYVKKGMSALDTGCGAGFNAIGIAELTGSTGSVDAVDVDPAALATLGRRAENAGLSDIINIIQCDPDTIGVSGEYDFAGAFWVAHEMPDQERYLGEVYNVLKPGGKMLVAEPKFHVKKADFNKMVTIAEKKGFKVIARPRIFMCMTVVFEK